MPDLDRYHACSLHVEELLGSVRKLEALNKDRALDDLHTAIVALAEFASMLTAAVKGDSK